MKKVLIINGHPFKESYNFALHSAYKKGLENSKHEVHEIILSDLKFNLILETGFQQEQTLEDDLIKAQELILWADHIVWIYPLWWGMMPALLKGFIDRTLLPGFAFKYRSGSSLWDKLLKRKTTEMICTLDYPIFYFKYFLNQGGVKVMKKFILEFCGLKVKRITYLGPIKTSKLNQREKWIQKVEKLAVNF